MPDIQKLVNLAQENANLAFYEQRLTDGFNGFITDFAALSDAQIKQFMFPKGSSERKQKARKWKLTRATSGKNSSIAGHTIHFDAGYTQTDLDEFHAFMERAMRHLPFFQALHEGKPKPDGSSIKMVWNPKKAHNQISKKTGKSYTTYGAWVESPEGKKHPAYDPTLSEPDEVTLLGIALLQAQIRAAFLAAKDPTKFRLTKEQLAQLGSLSNLKMLGVNGPNFAVDNVLIIQGKDGALRVLSGLRAHTLQRCLIGGMVEAGALQALIFEILEEACGGSLFRKVPDAELKASETGALLNILNPSVLLNFFAEIRFAKGDLALLKPLQTQINTLLSQANLSNNQKIAQISHLILHSAAIEPTQRNHLELRMRTLLFQEILKAQYDHFSEVIKAKLIKGAQDKVKTDPRGSNASSMVSTQFDGLMTEDELLDWLNQSGLELIAGDDLEKPGLCLLENFIQYPFCDHGRMLLNTVLRLINNGRLIRTPAIDKQLEQVERILLEQNSSLRQALEKMSVEEKQKIAGNRIFYHRQIKSL